MQKPDSQETDKISLEELLSLKQLERPDDAYWQRFERELHAKPWQKMVARPSWLRRVWGRLQENIHPAIPLGSTAALALVGYWSFTTMTTAELSPAPAPAQVLVAAIEAPAPAPVTMVAEASSDTRSADPHFVVGSFSATETSDPAFTTVASTHYMPATQRDGVHFAYNSIDSASHATLAMASGPVRSIY